MPSIHGSLWLIIIIIVFDALKDVEAITRQTSAHDPKIVVQIRYKAVAEGAAHLTFCDLCFGLPVLPFFGVELNAQQFNLDYHILAASDDILLSADCVCPHPSHSQLIVVRH